MVKVTTGAINYEPASSLKYKTGSWRSMKPTLDESKCKGCQLCFIYCPDSAIVMCERIIDGKAKKKAQINYDYCKGCGICAKECSADAITMSEEVK
jgi:pyruvate ferredoxin oxidoreductase delta subunit